ncbi:Polygalacturonase [Hibiscus syriacus]|uniref:Polygalacturonase n=1 Tax=Hibiscus syriacus TaxID=106335 RepID=A0A6A3B8G7_HIBSY|nr:Polygalacturonase [Hibiscus syriacus]
MWSFRANARTALSRFELTGPLVAPTDYRVIGNGDNWVAFKDVDGVMEFPFLAENLMPRGVACGLVRTPARVAPPTLSFSKSKNIVVVGLTLNSQMFHIIINGCQIVKLQGVSIIAAGNSPNTDGIHVQLSSGVTVLNSRIQTGDDCILIGPGATNLWMEKSHVAPVTHWSLGKDQNEAGVQNVTNVENPIVIHQNYCPGNKNCPDQVSGVKVSDVTYQDIHGTSVTEVAVNFDCSSKHPCSGYEWKG